MTKGFTLEGYDAKGIIRNADRVAKHFAEHSILCFKDVGLSETELLDVMRALGQAANFHAASIYRETHEQIDGKVVWHLENPHWPTKEYSDPPQTVGGWSMPHKTCLKSEGRGGFIDFADMYDALPPLLKYFAATEPVFLATAGECEWLEEEALQVCLREATEDDNIRPLALPHPVTGRMTLRLSPNFGIGLLDQSLQHFAMRLKRFVNEYVEDPANQFWWDWEEGDFVLVDLHYMCHTVSPFPKGSRTMVGVFGWYQN